jgi:hypothetical protein
MLTPCKYLSVSLRAKPSVPCCCNDLAQQAPSPNLRVLEAQSVQWLCDCAEMTLATIGYNP